MSKYTWLVDSGHGGIIGGVYQTAPKKMFTHQDGSVFYEGVYNRDIKHMFIDKLMAKNIACIDVCPSELDIPLSVRVDTINNYQHNYGDTVLISLHSNAGGGTGFEVWTSYGQTRSDKFAQILAEQLINDFPQIKFRADTADDDLDKESQFYILKWTDCPAVLPECLFFDTWKDYQLLRDRDFQDDYVNSLVRFVLTAENSDL